MTEPTAKLRLEATHVACGSPASAAAGIAVLSMFAALDVGRALHTANAEAAARQSSSHNGQRRVGAATGPGAVLATFATAAYLAILLDHQTPTRRRRRKKAESAQRSAGRATGLDATPVSVRCVFIPVTISRIVTPPGTAGTLIAQPVRFTKTPISMLSLLCPAALAEYDKCDRPAGKWAGFDQASKCQSMNQCASAVRLTLAPRLVLCRASAPPEAGRWFTATTTSTLAATGAFRPSPPLTIVGIG